MSLLDPSERTARGLAKQSQVIGMSPAEPRTLLQECWRDFVFAEIWSRPGLDLRSRFLISLAGSASSNGPCELLHWYVRGALTSDTLSLKELREAAMHLAVYGGFSRGAELDSAITSVADELGLAQVALPPLRPEPWDPAKRIAQGIAEFDKVMTFPGPPPISPFFEAGIDNFVFGEMWCRPGLDMRSRRWITVVGVCDSATDTPVRSHIHAAMASGNCTAEEMHEFVLQYAVHAGWPKASMVQDVVFAMAKKVAAGQPYDG